MRTPDLQNRIKIFWEQQDKFRNHPLLTELPNPETHNLSELAKDDVKEAIRMLQRADVKAISNMFDIIPALELLRADVLKTLKAGNKILICGCGASGRLAVALEYLWKVYNPVKNRNSLVGFLAGGDNAMIKSIEGFEDHKDFGIKQLYQAGFKDGDLLLSATASGESPFVIGSAEEAAKTSVKPYFIHCNTNYALKGRIKDHPIYNPDIKTLSLFVGPMALSGSTRMQATTALMLGIGLGLFSDNIKKDLEQFLKFFKSFDMTPIDNFIISESEAYKRKEFILYETQPCYGITTLTDTTERSPTFNLMPFENQLDSKKDPALCYILFSEAENSQSAWELLLGREPKTLDWTDETSFKRLMGFNFSKNIIDFRAIYAPTKHYFRVKKNDMQKVFLKFDNHNFSFDAKSLSPLFEQLLLKLILNTSSTIVMGRLGLYDGNLMTSLYPSNSKLIDRAIRYIDFLLKMKHKLDIPYETIANKMFKELEILQPGESIVNKTVAIIASGNGGSPE
ncbi:MAG: SIS domain-containing protein [Lentisphaerota bacterium]